MVFDDEPKLKEFLDLNEECKIDCEWTYKPLKNEYFDALVQTWNINEKYTGKYADEYKIISNHTGARTANKDQYGTMLQQVDTSGINGDIILQPIPDYICWMHSQNLHYLSYEKTDQLAKDKPEITKCDAFLPTRILDIFFCIDNDPADEFLQQLALLSWLPVEEVAKYFIKCREKAEKRFCDNIGRETWRKRPLYKLKMDELEQICRKKVSHSKERNMKLRKL